MISLYNLIVEVYDSKKKIIKVVINQVFGFSNILELFLMKIIKIMARNPKLETYCINLLNGS